MTSTEPRASTTSFSGVAKMGLSLFSSIHLRRPLSTCLLLSSPVV